MLPALRVVLPEVAELLLVVVLVPALLVLEPDAVPALLVAPLVPEVAPVPLPVETEVAERLSVVRLVLVASLLRRMSLAFFTLPWPLTLGVLALRVVKDLSGWRVP